MRTFVIEVSQNGGEYYGKVSIKGDVITKINVNTILVDGIEICFEHEYITDIKEER
ncbi:hypothetical protein PQE70_gp084 [Bacillus phage vB_BanS_Nate]|uniref:Uncharacterized protein n=1 Tax=Bacillus phage vB_BanS_Nate TaxID=2894788 RepID=A0AAE8YY19_9CAUD|nr:hypothetical protein PQE70_gp084 [Bacillus phage vB_BanS_Nate]UGO50937.1 hypothetical protein NATE_84 [Bacillus phage vB_BanS_Nate]